MKKTLSLILATVLLFALALPAAADEQTQTVTVNYEAPKAEYTLTIPQNQTMEDNTHSNIGMVHVTSSKDFFNQYLSVECQISEFKGQDTKLVFGGSMAFLPDGGVDENDLCGNAHSVFRAGSTEDSAVTTEAVPLILAFRNVTGEDGHLEDVAMSNTDSGPVQVDSLWAYVALSGNKAPTDTYTATVTYTASVKSNAN